MRLGQLPTAAELVEEEQPLANLVPPDKQPEYPAAWKLAVITIALCMAIFLVALVSAFAIRPACGIVPDRRLYWQDTTIVATAIPRITDHFKALDDGTPLFPFALSKSTDVMTPSSGMVWKCIPAHHLRVPTCVWKILFHLLHQIGLFGGNWHI